jgi:hypothetical protein
MRPKMFRAAGGRDRSQSSARAADTRETASILGQRLRMRKTKTSSRWALFSR